MSIFLPMLPLRPFPGGVPVWGVGWEPPAFFTSGGGVGNGAFAQSNRMFQFLPPAPSGGPTYPLVQLVGQVTRNSGKAYFEIECPVGSVQDFVGLGISPLIPGVSIFSDPNYWMINIFDNTSGAVDRSGTSGSYLEFTTPSTGLFQPLNDVVGFEIDCDAGQIDNYYINGVLQNNVDPDYATAKFWNPGTTVRPFAYARDKPFVLPSPVDEMNLCSLKLRTATSDFVYGPSVGYDAWDIVGGGSPPVPTPTPIEGNANVFPFTSGTHASGAGVVLWFSISDNSDIPGNSIFPVFFDATASGAGALLGIYNSDGVLMTSPAGEASITFNMMTGITLYIAVTFAPTFGQDFSATSAGAGGNIILSAT